MDAGSGRSQPLDPPNRDRAQRRARLLEELTEARELLDRVAPRRAAAARRRAVVRASTFRR
ncbi:MAG TPA: hypothetical protein VGL04_03445 [Sporichthyaceae bacterium]|jgi:hypothetical protein